MPPQRSRHSASPTDQLKSDSRAIGRKKISSSWKAMTAVIWGLVSSPSGQSAAAARTVKATTSTPPANTARPIWSPRLTPISPAW